MSGHKVVLGPTFRNEDHFTNSVRKAAQTLGWKVYHPFSKVLYSVKKKKSPGLRVTPGYPDLTLVKPPRVIFAELKMPKGYPTKAQKEWGALLEACPGVSYYLWKPKDWDEILSVLQSP